MSDIPYEGRQRVVGSAVGVFLSVASLMGSTACAGVAGPGLGEDRRRPRRSVRSTVRGIYRRILSGRVQPRRRSAGTALVALALLAPLIGCTTTSPSGKITYAGHSRVFELTSPNPLIPAWVDKTLTAPCAAGEFVLAGGYNLAVGDQTPIMNDWSAAHPTPKEAQPDEDGLYHPVPQLLRVVASFPHRNDKEELDGWNIEVAGLIYPAASASTVAVWAYCAAGLSVPPKLVDAGPQLASTVSPEAKALCPAGSVASGGGYSTGKYSYDGNKQTAYLPVSTWILRGAPGGSEAGWLVATDYRATFDPYPVANLTPLAVCVSTNDFLYVNSVMEPEIAIHPTNPDLRMTAFTVPIWGTNGSDSAYQGQISKPSPCKAGEFLLPPSFAAIPASHGPDVRVDGAWTDATLSVWTIKVSIGGSTNYSNNTAVSFGGNFPVFSWYPGCLVAK
jgi:hypothetical protein